ncbi:MAG: hypothetical protein DRJ05_15105 [Bacteroidetes bacterium]|nr:MAG: hypothetical protein DRJ05_15105 [Bacteroidota bacterium]
MKQGSLRGALFFILQGDNIKLRNNPEHSGHKYHYKGNGKIKKSNHFPYLCASQISLYLF